MKVKKLGLKWTYKVCLLFGELTCTLFKIFFDLPTPSDTHELALLIDERDEILENLEIAETKYINSFRLTTPDPSIADFEPPEPQDPNRPYISRPKPLGGTGKVRMCYNCWKMTLIRA